MEDKYGECNKSHEELGRGKDGCLEFMPNSYSPLDCAVCGCHRTYHRKVIELRTEVVYTYCKRFHYFTKEDSWDGCQEFFPKNNDEAAALECAACGCHKAFHRDEVSKRVDSTS
ncbi:hypothetical protein ABFS82_10G118000 [Erythranthe guttata]